MAIHVHAYSYTVTHGIYIQTNVDIVTSHMVTNTHIHRHACMVTHEYTRTVTYLQTHVHAYTLSRMHTHLHIHMHQLTHTHTHIHTHTLKHKFICTHSTKQLNKYQAHIKLTCDALPEFFLMAQNDGVKNPFIAMK